MIRPQGLADYRQFILWTSEPSNTRPGKIDKFPIHPQQGYKINAQDPANWMSFEEALQAHAADIGHSHGIGFVFTESDPFFFLDIDNAAVNGQWSEIARTLYNTFAGCYFEVSQSGTGMHIIGSTCAGSHGHKNDAHGLELYTQKRFVALTGTHASGNALTYAQEQYNWLVGSYFPAHAIAACTDWTYEPVPEWSGPLDDDELIEKMLASKTSASAMFGGRASVQDLWNANEDALSKVWQDPRGFDHSSADLALCSHLAFWTGKDCERTDRLFRQSGLMREKWERPNYKVSTVLKAVSSCNVVLGSDSNKLGDSLSGKLQDAPISNHSKDSLFICASEVLREPIRIRKLVGKTIERECTGQIFGPSGSKKSFVALDISLAIATGGKWNGHQCEQGLVLYFIGEGLPGMKRRIKAWFSHHGQPDPSNFHYSRNAISFDEGGLKRVKTEIEKLEATTGKKIVFIVIDTLARHLEGDENSTKDMSRFVQLVDGLRNWFPDSTALIVHHTGNDPDKLGRSRGSSALKAACDFEIQCFKDVLTFTKMKDSEEPPPIEFKLIPKLVGYDEDNLPVHSCIVEYGERSAKNRQDKLTHDEEELYSFVDEHPYISPDGLRSKFIDLKNQLKPNSKPNTLNTAYRRAFKGLIDMGMIYIDGNIIKTGHGTNGGQAGHLSSINSTGEGDIQGHHP